MKMVMIAYNEAVDEELMEVLKVCCCRTAFTKWTQVQGQGQQSEPHMLTHVWPKANNVMMVCAEDEVAAKILGCVRELRKKLGKEGVKAFVWSVEDIS